MERFLVCWSRGKEVIEVPRSSAKGLRGLVDAKTAFEVSRCAESDCPSINCRDIEVVVECSKSYNKRLVAKLIPCVT